MTPSSITVSAKQAFPVERFRPNPWAWLLILYFVPVSLGMIAISLWLVIEPKSKIWEPNAFLSVCGVLNASWMLFLFICMAALAVRLLTEQICVSDGTLSWRTWRGTTAVSWSEVLDYYDDVQVGLHVYEAAAQKEADPQPYSYKRMHVGVIVTSQGLCRFSHSWPRAAALREHVVKRASHARASRWELLGARPDRDWPRTFDYPPQWRDSLLFSAPFLLVGTFFAFAAPPAWEFARGVQADMGWSWASLLIGLAAVLGLVLVGVVVVLLRVLAQARRRRMQSITLTPEGIIYVDPERRVEALWSEVSGLRIGRDGQGGTIDTQHGTFDFSGSIRHNAALIAAVAAQTRATLPGGWQDEGTDHLARKTASINPTRSERAFTYRTSNNRAFLVFSTVMSYPLSYLSYQLVEGLREFPESAGGTIFTVLMLAVFTAGAASSLWGWWNFFVARIQTDDEGITLRTPFKTKRIAWADVHHIETRGAEMLTAITLYGAQERIHYSALIANGEQLAAEIERHTGKDLGLL